MKKLFSFFIVLAFTVNTALASSMLPDNTSMVISVAPGKLQGMLNTSLFSLLDTQLDLKRQYAETEAEKAEFDLFKQALKEQTFSLSIQDFPEDLYGDPQMTFSTELSSEDYRNIILPAIEEELAKETPEFRRETEGDYTYYTDDEFYLFYEQEHFLFGNSKDNILKVLKGETLELPEQVNHDSLLYAHLKIDELVEQISSQEPELKKMVEEIYGTMFLTEETFSLNQTAEGFEIEALLLLDESKVKLPPKIKGEYRTKLYNYLPSENVMLFTNNLSVLDGKSMFSTKALEEINKELAYATDQFQIEDLLDLVGTENAISIQDVGEMYPALTMLTSPESTASAAQMASDITESLEELVSSEITQVSPGVYYDQSEGITVSFSTVQIPGQETTKLHQLEIAKELEENINPYAPQYDTETNRFVLTYGVTADDVLLFSTNKNILQEYGAGYSMGEQYNMYIDFRAVENYLLSILTQMETAQANIGMDMSEEKEALKKLMAPWQSITQKDNYTPNSMGFTMNINTDVDKMFLQYPMLFSELEQLNTEEKLSSYFDSSTELNDISNQWYADDVYYLTATGVVNGSYDFDEGVYNYNPEQNLNRAEVVKLVIETLDKTNHLDNFNKWDNYTGELTDLEGWEWYAAHLEKAQQLGLISGYQDKTFRGENDITRAEFAAVLAKLINQYEVKVPAHNFEITFTDVQEGDWYYDNVLTVAKHALMNGSDGKFRPNEPLNRAEAAKVIRDLFTRL